WRSAGQPRLKGVLRKPDDGVRPGSPDLRACSGNRMMAFGKLFRFGLFGLAERLRVRAVLQAGHEILQPDPEPDHRLAPPPLPARGAGPPVRRCFVAAAGP